MTVNLVFGKSSGAREAFFRKRKRRKKKRNIQTLTNLLNMTLEYSLSKRRKEF